MPKRSSTNEGRTLDESQLAKSIVDELTTDDLGEALSKDARHLIAVALGRRGGLKGGKARAQKLSAKRRKEIASMAAKSRWSKVQDE
jgi:hypothetical protein